MVYLLNSAVIPAGGYGRYEYRAATWAELREALDAAAHGGVRVHADGRWPTAVASRVGYRETAQVIQAQTGWWPPESRAVTVLEPGDVAYVVRLKYRVDPGSKGRPVAARLEAWEVGRLERLT